MNKKLTSLLLSAGILAATCGVASAAEQATGQELY